MLLVGVLVGCGGANAGSTWCDHPSDSWGWAVASGLIINTPWIAPGDIFGVWGAYGVGASTYASGNNLTSPGGGCPSTMRSATASATRR